MRYIVDQKPTVLVVDDHLENIIAIEAVLQSANYSVARARSGKEAIRRLKTEDCALILLDLHMPILNGLETAKLIRKIPPSAETPIIFMTAHEKDEEAVFEAYDSGAVDYISQPINPKILRSKVAIFVSLFQQKQELRQIKKRLEGEVQEKTSNLERTNDELKREIGIREEIEQRLLQETLHDSLTGLPNRTLFGRTLLRCLRGRKLDADYSFAVLFLDVDDFKSINDLHGHPVGDHVLAAVAYRLEFAVRPGDMVARMGGDEFAILLDRVTDNTTVEEIAKRILSQFQAPITLQNLSARVSISMGIATCYSPFESGPEEILRKADAAMYAAKRLGKGQYHFQEQISKS
jgi:diguanylate cyclase (GGDEF)-like protein